MEEFTEGDGWWWGQVGRVERACEVVSLRGCELASLMARTKDWICIFAFFFSTGRREIDLELEGLELELACMDGAFAVPRLCNTSPLEFFFGALSFEFSWMDVLEGRGDAHVMLFLPGGRGGGGEDEYEGHTS